MQTLRRTFQQLHLPAHSECNFDEETAGWLKFQSRLLNSIIGP